MSDEQAILNTVPFSDPERAGRILRGLAGGGVTDDMVEQLLPSLLAALGRSPDPDRALNNFDRWTNAVTSRYTHFQLLLHHPAALDIFFAVCGTSQLFSDILIRNPEYVEILTNPAVRDAARPDGAILRELSALIDRIVRPELKLEAMRRFKQREILRIGTRDILGLAPMPATAREFSDLADACVVKCLEVASGELTERFGEPPPPFAVIAMGKLGGRELNYSSDIDLMFVGEGAEYALKLAERVVAGLTKNMQNGHLFRVDMRLRPEGRFGALVRTIESYRDYYESWAEPWERQALIKARCIAGDVELGRQFIAMVEPFVYRRAIGVDFVDAIRRNKERIEQKAEVEGVAHTNVKVGVGGIRDVEFTVQLLQLELGGRRPAVRGPNTLDAIARLRHAGALTREEARELSDDYIFLRNVEHRLQILYELQTQRMPTDPHERTLLARRLGFVDGAAFDTEYEHRTRRVRGHLERLFYRRGPREQSGAGWAELLAAVDTVHGRAAIERILSERGFRDPARAAAMLRSAVAGTEYGRAQPEASALVAELAGPLVSACARTGDPDAAFAGIDELATSAPNRAELYRALAQGEELLDRLAQLAAGSPPLIHALSRHPEWMDMLVSEEAIDPAPKSAARMVEELRSRLPKGGRQWYRGTGGQRATPGRSTLNASRTTPNAFWDVLAVYIQRERLRIGARDLWGEAAPLVAARELTSLAEAVIQVLLDRGIELIAEREPAAREALSTVAVIGLGKLGGGELGYGSDWDVLLCGEWDSGRVAEWERPDTASSTTLPLSHSAAESLAEWLLAAGQELRTRGAPVTLDARLRPEGRFGALVRTVGELRSYYVEQAETWERQTLTKARPVAGCEETAAEYMAAVRDAIYGDALSAERRAEIIAMKRRIESERLKPEQRNTDLKLGHGGLSDIEFTVQLLQLKEGWRVEPARSSSTVHALTALAEAVFIARRDADWLSAAFGFILALRNRLSLLGGISTDALPADAVRLRIVAIGLGFADGGEASAEAALQSRTAALMREVRQITDRLFYGAP